MLRRFPQAEARMGAKGAPVAIIMGSRSDWPTMKAAADILDTLQVAL